MLSKKTLPQREKELQTLLATPAGRKQLESLENSYHDTTGRPRAANTSVITYILVYEREKGLIEG